MSVLPGQRKATRFVVAFWRFPSAYGKAGF